MGLNLPGAPGKMKDESRTTDYYSGNRTKARDSQKGNHLIHSTKKT